MKVASIDVRGRRWVARIDEEAGTASPFDLPESAALSGVVCLIERQSMPECLEAIRLEDVEVLAPIPLPARNIFCVGKNYHEHAHEFARSGFDSSAAAGAVPEAPIIFSKVPDCVIAPGAAIRIDPAVSAAVGPPPAMGTPPSGGSGAVAS